MVEATKSGYHEQLWQAAWTGDLLALDRLIASGVDVNAMPDTDLHCWPALGAAIEQLELEVVRRLIQAGANVNASLKPSWNPLEHAIDIESDAAWQAHHETGHVSTELTEILLAAGALPTARAFEVAQNYNNHRALELLNRYASSARNE